MSSYVGDYVVGRMQNDNGVGIDPIDFRVRIYENRFEWIGSSDVTTSHFVSVLPADETRMMVTTADGKTLELRTIQNGVSIRDDSAGKTLLCTKEAEQREQDAAD